MIPGRQSKRATLGKKNHWRCINCVIKRSATKQWHFQRIPKSEAIPSCATLWNKHTPHTWSPKPAVADKRDDGHTQREKVVKWHTAGTDVRAKTLPVYRCGLRFRWSKKTHTHKNTHKSFISGEERLQWFSKYDRRKNRGIEDMLKEIDPSICTDTFYISIIQRETDSTRPDKGGHHSTAAELWQHCDEDE